jgi:hypothetical protein
MKKSLLTSMLVAAAMLTASFQANAGSVALSVNTYAGMTVTSENGVYMFSTTADPSASTPTTPYFFTMPLTADAPAALDSLRFEYQSTAASAWVQVWYGNTWDASRQTVFTTPVQQTTDWKVWEVSIGADRSKTSWGVNGEMLMINFHFPKGTTVKMRNLALSNSNYSGVSGVNANSLKVYAANGAIYVNAPAQVYNMAGQLVGKTESSIEVPAGIYIVKANGAVKKVAVK